MSFRTFVILGALIPTISTAQVVDIETGAADLKRLAEEARLAKANLSFEEFRDQTLFVPETGKFYVSGDVPIRNEKLLREFWDQNVRNAPPVVTADSPEFAIGHVGGLDQVWNSVQKHRLSYCVSHSFGHRHANVVADMQAATAAWETVADLSFIYDATQDASCNNANQNVLFDVRPVNANGQFLAAAFFPNDPRAARSVVIDGSSFQLNPTGNLTLQGILRHELGHVVGARHEHTRPEAGACFEDDEWRGVTNYDGFSVMHYPQCNGLGDWTLTLTPTDKSGVACIYGAAAGFSVDTSICRPAGAFIEFGPFTLAENEMKQFDPIAVSPGLHLTVQMFGVGNNPGDPDLYLKFEAPALLTDFDCRPFTTGADEICDVIVPEGSSVASVMVNGFTQGSFRMEITQSTLN